MPTFNNDKVYWNAKAFKYKKFRVPNMISETNWQNNEKSRIEKTYKVLNNLKQINNKGQSRKILD